MTCPVTPPDPIYKQPHNATGIAKRPSPVNAATDLGFLGLHLSQDNPRHCSLNSSQYLKNQYKTWQHRQQNWFPPSVSSRRLVWFVHLPFQFLSTPLWAHTIWRWYIIKTFHFSNTMITT